MQQQQSQKDICDEKPTKIESGLIVVCVVIAVQIISMMMMRQITPIYLEHLDAPAAIVGLAVSAFALLPLLISMPGGMLVDRIGYRKVVQIGALLTIISSILMALLPPALVVIAAQMIGGLANILVILATQAYVSNLAPEDRTRNFGLYSFSFGLGFLVSPPLAGLINDTWGFSASFIAAALTAAVVLCLTTLMEKVKPDDKKNNQDMTLPIAVQQCSKLLSKPLVQLALGISMCVLLIMTLKTSFYIVYLERTGFSTTRIGILVAIQEGVALLFRPFLPQLSAYLGKLPLISLSMVIGGVGIAATPFFGQFTPLFIAAMLHGITPAFSQPISMVMMSNSSPRKTQGMAMGLRQMANQAPLFVGPIIFGVIVTYFSLSISFILAGIILFLGALSLMYIHVRMKTIQS